MQVSSVTTAREPSAYAAGSTTATTSKSSNLGQKDFLQLLAKQYENQDPMKPMEDTAFIAQMAQFTSLEQTSSLLAEMTAMSGKQDIATANSYLGRQVTVDDGNGGTAVGEATGVEVTAGVPRLVIGEYTYALSSVLRVAPKPVPPATGAAS